jgi:hypothetical protein
MTSSGVEPNSWQNAPFQPVDKAEGWNGPVNLDHMRRGSLAIGDFHW